MERLRSLQDLLFPVVERPIFAEGGQGAAARSLPIPGKKAIVNAAADRVVGVVARSYRVVTNQEALDLARQCCRAAFGGNHEGEWQVRSVDAPQSGAHCYIDLVHNSGALDFETVVAKDRPDAYGPFIRVTNSYNGLRALTFDIGFYRKVCANGLMLRQSQVQFKFAHGPGVRLAPVEFERAGERFTKLKEALAGYLKVFRGFLVPNRHLTPLVEAVLRLRPRIKPSRSEMEAWDGLHHHVQGICDRYEGQLGENAYAALNAVTEFASAPPSNRLVNRERHGLQRLAGAWVTDFSRRCQSPGFSLDEYIPELGVAGDEPRIEAAPGRPAHSHG